MEQHNLYLTQSELPPHHFPSPIPIPAPASPNCSFLSHISSPTPFDTSSSLTVVDPEYGLDEDAIAHNQSFIVRMGGNRPIISAPTRLLHILIVYCPVFLLSAFGVLVEAIIERTAPTMSAPTAIFLHLETLRPLVCLSNVTFAVNGDICT